MKNNPKKLISLLIMLLILFITIVVALLLNMFGIIELGIDITNNTTVQNVIEESTPNGSSAVEENHTTDLNTEVTTDFDPSTDNSTETSDTNTDVPETTEIPSTQAQETTQEPETTLAPDVTTSPHSHTYGAWKEIKAPTCTVAGEKTRTCSCGEKETASVAALGHTEVVDKAVAATCTKTGLTEGKHCSVCNKVIVAQTKVPTVSHTYDDKYDTTCNVCGYVRVAECKHTNTQKLAGQAATCTAAGLTEGKKCVDCSEILVAQTIIPATGHTAGEWTTVTNPTCTAAGTKEQKCKVCGTVVNTSSIAALGHTEVIDKAVAATCTASGLTEGKHCSVCNVTIVAQKSVSALGHKEVTVKAVAPTCTATGLTEGKYCSVCNITIVTQTVVKALGHTEVIDKAVAATCDKTGLTEGKRCSVCNAVLVAQTTIPAKGHSYKNGVCEACGAQRTSTGLAYSVNSDGKTCTITGIGTCTDTDVFIPSKIDGYTVTGIGKKAFAELPSLTSIVLPDTVETIGDRAFYKTNITEFTLPESLAGNGTQVFYGCNNLKTVYYKCSNYKVGFNSIILQDVKSLEKIVFDCETIPKLSDLVGDISGYNTVKTVEMTDKVTTIPNEAFSYYHTNLTTVIIGNNVTSIGHDAFYGCTGLTSIVIPDSVTYIGYNAFPGCTNLKDVTLSNNLTAITESMFAGCTSLKSITIPDSVEYIGSYAFSGCTSLTSVIIPDSVKDIYSYAFNECTSLTSLDLPDSVTGIGNDAFSGCSSLTNFTIPDSVTYIGEYAFSNCTSLTNMVIPDSVTSIRRCAFGGCSSLTSVVIPGRVKNIDSYAFSNCYSLTNISIGYGVTTIENYAFDKCKSLRDVYFTGTEAEWNEISIGSYSGLNGVTLHYNSQN